MIPDHITPAQLTAGLAAMGLDAGEVKVLTYERTRRLIDVDLLPPGMPDSVEYVAAKIPIRDAAPPPADLIGELKEAQDA